MGGTVTAAGRARASLAVVAMMALSSTARAAAPPPSPLSLTPCASEGAMKDAWCGALSVPEDPRRPEGRQVALRIVVLRALSPTPGAAPLFHLDGGPGVAASGAAGFYLGPGSGYRRTRDVVLVDQRGTGGSRDLRCPQGSVADRWAEQLRTCLAGLDGDPGAYTTAWAMDDLDQVRAALGYERVNLYGMSYGVTAAQVYLQRHPTRVRSAILESGALLGVPIYEQIRGEPRKP